MKPYSASPGDQATQESLREILLLALDLLLDPKQNGGLPLVEFRHLRYDQIHVSVCDNLGTYLIELEEFVREAFFVTLIHSFGQVAQKLMLTSL